MYAEVVKCLTTHNFVHLYASISFVIGLYLLSSHATNTQTDSPTHLHARCTSAGSNVSKVLAQGNNNSNSV